MSYCFAIVKFFVHKFVKKFQRVPQIGAMLLRPVLLTDFDDSKLRRVMKLEAVI